MQIRLTGLAEKLWILANRFGAQQSSQVRIVGVLAKHRPVDRAEPCSRAWSNIEFWRPDGTCAGRSGWMLCGVTGCEGYMGQNGYRVKDDAHGT